MIRLSSFPFFPCGNRRHLLMTSARAERSLNSRTRPPRHARMLTSHRLPRRRRVRRRLRLRTLRLPILLLRHRKPRRRLGITSLASETTEVAAVRRLHCSVQTALAFCFLCQNVAQSIMCSVLLLRILRHCMLHRSKVLCPRAFPRAAPSNLRLQHTWLARQTRCRVCM